MINAVQQIARCKEIRIISEMDGQKITSIKNDSRNTTFDRMCIIDPVSIAIFLQLAIFLPLNPAS
jgi:hypothetical protein